MEATTGRSNITAEASRLAHAKQTHEQLAKSAQVSKSVEPTRCKSAEDEPGTGAGVEGGVEVRIVFIYYY